MEVFHGTTEKNAEEILKDSFNVSDVDINTPSKMINDLGNGVYTFCEDDHNFWNPQENAFKYADVYKNFHTKGEVTVVLAVEIVDDEATTYLDLDEEENKKRMQQLITLLSDRVAEIYQEIPSSGAKRRQNLDGILIELAIQTGRLKDVDYVLKETYTAFTKRTLSNFPNGRELVIRHLDKIKETPKLIRKDV